MSTLIPHSGIGGDNEDAIWCNYWLNPWTSFLTFGAAVGAIGLLDALVGLASAFISMIPWVAVLALDAIAVGFYMAGGVVSDIKYSGV